MTFIRKLNNRQILIRLLVSTMAASLTVSMLLFTIRPAEAEQKDGYCDGVYCVRNTNWWIGDGTYYNAQGWTGTASSFYVVAADQLGYNYAHIGGHSQGNYSDHVYKYCGNATSCTTPTSYLCTTDLFGCGSSSGPHGDWYATTRHQLLHYSYSTLIEDYTSTTSPATRSTLTCWNGSTSCIW